MVVRIEEYIANWHQPSMAVENALNDINDIDIVKYDMDKDFETFLAKDISYLPTIIFIDDKFNELGRIKGAITSSLIRSLIKKFNKNGEE